MGMKWVITASLCALVTVMTPAARALEDDGTPPGPFGAIHAEAAARFSAIVGDPVAGTPGFRVGGGFGGRTGASYLGFYGGMSFLDLMSEGSCTESITASCGNLQRLSYGVEAGYGRTLYRRLLIRGVLGFGDYVEIANGTTTTCLGSPLCTMSSVTELHDTSHNLYLQPGILLALTLGPVLIGLDANVFYMPDVHRAGGGPIDNSSPYAAFMAGGQLGARL